MKFYFLQWIVRVFVPVALMLSTTLVTAAPNPLWLVHDENSTIEVSHDSWQDLLDKYLDADHASGVNRFDYAAVERADLKLLEKYLDSLQEVDPRLLSKNEQLAYWVNLYNALTVQVILDEYPVESIRNIRFLTSPFGPWDKNFVEVQGEDLSLNDIEHEILRPIWKDPRIHFAVNCASIGCPNLVGEAFTAVNADELMTAAAHDFIGHTRGVEVKGDTVVLSSIFDWYAGDFGEDEAEVVDYVAKFVDSSDVEKLKSASKFKYQYDWKLNKP